VRFRPRFRLRSFPPGGLRTIGFVRFRFCDFWRYRMRRHIVIWRVAHRMIWNVRVGLWRV
jgi:hypothetical protein